MNAVVDTSVWIDFFRGSTIPALEDALAGGMVVMPPIVVTELISGARTARDRRTIADLLDRLALHETPRSHWIQAGMLRRDMRAAGVAVSTRDAHVAQCALDLDAVLLSRDAVFRHIADVVPLRLL